jgi:hypothetical protein
LYVFYLLAISFVREIAGTDLEFNNARGLAVKYNVTPIIKLKTRDALWPEVQAPPVEIKLISLQAPAAHSRAKRDPCDRRSLPKLVGRSAGLISIHSHGELRFAFGLMCNVQGVNYKCKRAFNAHNINLQAAMAPHQGQFK